MAIRRTESRLPQGYLAEDLGQVSKQTIAMNIGGNNIDISLSLISYLRSPVSVSSEIDFVLFIENVPQADWENWEFNWVARQGATNELVKEEAGAGESFFAVTPKKLGTMRTTVELIRNNARVATIVGTHEIINPNENLEILLGNDERIKVVNDKKTFGSLGGDEDVSRELINNFRHYVFEAIKPTALPPLPPNPPVDIPYKLLAALTYALIQKTPKRSWLMKDRNNGIQNAADDLSDDDAKARSFVFNLGIGVCGILPQVMAMALQRPGTTTTYTPWIELTWEQQERKNQLDRMVTNLNALPDAVNVKVDLFNLARFPKSNLRLCAIFMRKLIDRSHRWPGLTSRRLLDHDLALKIVLTEYNLGPFEFLLSPATGPPSPNDMQPNLFGTRVIDTVMRIPALAIYFIDAKNDGSAAYGGYDLGRDENGASVKWLDGQKTMVAQEDVPFIKALQEDLIALGFKIVGEADGVFSERAEWAVREFQLYAKMPFVAQQSAGGNLNKILNILPYTGLVSGVVNLTTRILIQYWKGNQWRCPVVIQAYNGAGVVLTGMNNLWMSKDCTDTAAKVKVRDFSGYYESFAHTHAVTSQPLVAGKYYTDQWHGPVSTHEHAWKGDHSAEVTSVALFGIGEAALGQDTSDQGTKTRRTFKVVRVLSEIENLGYFDSINCWDSAYLSMGICHWTIGRPGKEPEDPPREANLERDGELIGYLSFLQSFEPKAYASILTYFGVGVSSSWVDDDEYTGKKLFKKGHRKYSGWLTLQQENGSYKTVDEPPYKSITENESTSCGNYYFKTWHWFYRFQMAARTIIPFRKRMWDFARIRLRDILTTPWGVPSSDAKITDNGKFTDRNGTVRDIEIGDVFTSEKAVCLLLRWHVNYPTNIIAYDFTAKTFNPGNKVYDSFKKAKLVTGFSTDIKEWNDDHEKALVSGIRTVVGIANGLPASPSDLQQSLFFVDKFPPTSGTNEEYGYARNSRYYTLNLDAMTASGETKQLSEGRRSFKFDSSGLNDIPPPYNREVDYYNWG